MTLLMFLADSDADEELIRMVLALGADTTKTNRLGKTAFSDTSRKR